MFGRFGKFILLFLKRLFVSRDIAIATDFNTKQIHLPAIVQVIFLTVFVYTVVHFSYRYNRYKNYHNYYKILEENDRLIKEQHILRKQFEDYDIKAGIINEYLSAVMKNNNTIIKMPLKNDISNGGFDAMNKKINEHKSYLYAVADSFKKRMIDYMHNLESSSILYNKRTKTAKVSNDIDVQLFGSGNGFSDNMYIGGPREAVKFIKIGNNNSIFKIASNKIDNNNFDNELKKMILVQKTLNVLPFGSPADSDYRLTSSYGFRNDPINENGGLTIHRGVDMVISNKKVLSTGDGVVVFAGFKNGYGYCIDVEHGSSNTLSVITHYAHLDEILVSKGQSVKKGDQIGIQGNTGRSTGPHLHYEVRFANKTINPMKLLFKS